MTVTWTADGTAGPVNVAVNWPSNVRTAEHPNESAVDSIEAAIGDCATALENLVFFDDLDDELVTAWANNSNPHVEACLSRAQANLIASWDTALSHFNRTTALVNAQRDTLRRGIASFESELIALGIDYQTFAVARPKQIDGEMPAFSFQRTFVETLNYGRGGANIVGQAVRHGNWQVAALAAVVSLGAAMWNESKVTRRLADAQGLLGQLAETARGDMRMLATRLRTHTVPFYRDVREAKRSVAQWGEALRQLRLFQPYGDNLREPATRLAMGMATAAQLLKEDAG